MCENIITEIKARSPFLFYCDMQVVAPDDGVDPSKPAFVGPQDGQLVSSFYVIYTVYRWYGRGTQHRGEHMGFVY